MLSKGIQRLADDHVALDELLKQLQTALDHGDVDAGFAKLDLFWAKLAVHIRAEHLQLFPSVLDGLSANAEGEIPAPRLSGTLAAIKRLRMDHEFFMRQLARAIEMIHGLVNVSDHQVIDEGLINIRRTIFEVEQRLADHNQLEEDQIYQVAGMVLNAEEQAELAKRIVDELENRPPRFAAAIW
jgi:hypothetical protein